MGLARWAGTRAQSTLTSNAARGTSRNAMATHAGMTSPARAQRTFLTESGNRCHATVFVLGPTGRKS